MNVTLRKASALQNSINEAIRGIDIKSEIALTEFHKPEDEIASAVAVAKANIARRDALNSALYVIRGAVAEVNNASGVSRKLTEVAEIEKQIQFYSGLAGKEVRESADVLAGKLRKMSETEVKSRIYGYSDTVSTGVFSAEDIAGFKQLVATFKRLKQKLQDEILEANVRNEIALDNETAELLKKEGLL